MNDACSKTNQKATGLKIGFLAEDTDQAWPVEIKVNRNGDRQASRLPRLRNRPRCEQEIRKTVAQASPQFSLSNT